MANVPLKTKKYRTTSETLRLSECDLLNQNSTRVNVSASSNNIRKKLQTSPSCSFQITGVSLTRCDFGEDSADDLDESHTDDISRVTDNETPSFSEDSKDTDDHLYHQVNGVPPATAQPAQVKQIDVNIQDVKTKNVNESDIDYGRFKVVKIESLAPFNRGRWTCFDYLDHNEQNKVSNIYCQLITQDSSNEDNGSINFTNSQNKCMFPENYLISESAPILISNNTNQKSKIRYSPTNIIASTQSLKNSDRSDTKQLSGEVESSTTDNVLPPNSVNNQIPSNVGTSTPCTNTIDSKIEHALDVVKDHLTQAVRLEVEELKLKINELVDRINYLEYENDLLRANVYPELLTKLENQTEK